MTYDAGRPCCDEYERMQRRIKELEINLSKVRVQRDNALSTIKKIITIVRENYRESYDA